MASKNDLRFVRSHKFSGIGYNKKAKMPKENRPERKTTPKKIAKIK